MNPLIIKYGRDILLSENMQKEKKFMSHGAVSCYDHSVNVAEMSLDIAKKLGIRVDVRSLVRGSLLHDYYLYDWHEKDKSHRMHGFHHAKKALENAMRDFTLSKIERDIIVKHMFPLTFPAPKYRESWIVCIADTLCAAKETVLHKNKKSVAEMQGGR